MSAKALANVDLAEPLGPLTNTPPIAGLIAILSARIFYVKLLSVAEGTDKMKEIAGYVKEGAMAYLKRQYRVISIVFTIVFILLVILAALGVQNFVVPFIFFLLLKIETKGL